MLIHSELLKAQTALETALEQYQDNDIPTKHAVDIAAEVKRTERLLAKLKSSVNDQIKAEGPGEIEGLEFVAKVTEVISWTLDTKLVKEEMGEAWYTKHSKQTCSTRVTVSI